VASGPILSARFSCAHGGQAGLFRKAHGDVLPKVFDGFHLESGRQGPDRLPLVVCDRCDEIMELWLSG